MPLREGTSDLPADQQKPLPDPKTINMDLLKRIGAGTYVNVGEADDLIARGLVEVNSSMEEKKGKVAIKLTDDGVAYNDQGRAAVSPPDRATHWPSKEEKEARKEEYPIFNVKRTELGEDYDSLYPFGDLKIGQAFFVPNKSDADDSLDKHVEAVYQAAHRAKLAFSTIEHDENGDDIQDSVLIKVRKRDADGNIERDSGTGLAQVSASSGYIDRRTFYRHFSVVPIRAGADVGSGKVDRDGALVVREF